MYVGVYPLQLGLELWGTLQGNYPLSFFGSHLAYAEVLVSAKEIVKHVFPEGDSTETEIKILKAEELMMLVEESGTTADPLSDLQFAVTISKKENVVVGFSIEHVVRGKWGPIRYLLSVDPKGHVMDVSVREYRERRGRPISRKRFLRQFKNKDISDKLRWQKDIRGVTGASISSKGITDGVRKLLHVFRHFYDT
jgi:Na+-translocating ferredoxin:NAD+ oxidoreductase RnfG subunit